MYAMRKRNVRPITDVNAGYDRQHAQDKRQDRRSAAAGNAGRSGDTWSSASGI
jgi:hypothetical protein